MVSYHEQQPRDVSHHQFIRILQRKQAARLFESHVLDIERAARRCVARTLDSQAFLLLLRHQVQTLSYYVTDGPLEKALAAHGDLQKPSMDARCRDVEEALDEALDVFIQRHSDEDDDAGASGAILESPSPESDDSQTAKEDCLDRQSESGTEIAITNS